MASCMTKALLTYCRAERLCPVIVTGFKLHSDLVQVAEASFALIGSDEAKILLALCLRERVEDVMDLQEEMTSEETVAQQVPEPSPVSNPGTPAYVDPDIGDFFVNDKGLHVLGDSSGSRLPLGLILRGWDEEGRGQEDKL